MVPASIVAVAVVATYVWHGFGVLVTVAVEVTVGVRVTVGVWVAVLVTVEVGSVPVVVTVAVAAVTATLTPMAHHNLVIYRPGGYRFLDYTRIGAPLTLLIGAIVAVIAPRLWSA